MTNTYFLPQIIYMLSWLVVSTHLKNISQNENLPQIRVNIKNTWNHQLVSIWASWPPPSSGDILSLSLKSPWRPELPCGWKGRVKEVKWVHKLKSSNLRIRGRWILLVVGYRPFGWFLLLRKLCVLMLCLVFLGGGRGDFCEWEKFFKDVFLKETCII